MQFLYRKIRHHIQCGTIMDVSLFFRLLNPQRNNYFWCVLLICYYLLCLYFIRALRSDCPESQWCSSCCTLDPWEISIPNNLGRHIFHTHKLCFYWTCSIDFPRLALNMPHCLPCSLRPRRDSSCNREWKMHHPPNIWSNWCHRSSILMVNSKFLVNVSSSMTISCNRGCIVISHMWVGMLK